MLKTDQLSLRDLEFEVVVGILPRERVTAQRLKVDVDLDIGLVPSALSCDISQTFDYANAGDEFGFILAASQFLLIESAAFALTAYLLGSEQESGVPHVAKASVTIKKPEALGGNGYPVVKIERSVGDLTFRKEKHGNWTETLLFECKDSLILRYYSKADFPGPIPAPPQDYKCRDLPLKRPAGHHVLRVLRI